MDIKIKEFKGVDIAEVISDGVVIFETQGALDLMANCGYQGSTKIILREENLSSAFFDLKSGRAGEVLQKFSNYCIQVAIVGDYSKYSRKSLRVYTV